MAQQRWLKITWNAVYTIKLEGEELLMVKKGLECTSLAQNFEIEIFKGKMGKGNISRKIILKNSKGIC